MTLAVTPAWVAPTASAIRDAHRLAATERGPRAEAMADTFAWLEGEHPSPLQARPAGPVAHGDVVAELKFAQRIMSGPEQLVAGDRAGGVERVLVWLLGLRDVGPVPLPERGEDGLPLTADQLYAARICGQPPERRTAVWAGAVRDAARYAALAARIDPPAAA